MTQVRQDMRQPVSSLWQPGTERASTAPTRMLRSAGSAGVIDATHGVARARMPRSAGSTEAIDATHSITRGSSRHRSHSELCKTTGVESLTSSPGVTATRTTGDTCLGVGAEGAIFNADGDNGGNIRGRRAPVEGELGTFSAPICGSSEQELNGNVGGRRTPLPLRSSHRVGPIGTLGQRRPEAEITIFPSKRPAYKLVLLTSVAGK